MKTPLYNVHLRKTGKEMVIVIYFVEQIEDQHSKFGYSNVPRIYKKRVREMLIMHGNGDLAKEGVNNYIGPRPPLVLEDMLAAADEKYRQEQERKANEAVDHNVDSSKIKAGDINTDSDKIKNGK